MHALQERVIFCFESAKEFCELNQKFEENYKI